MGLIAKRPIGNGVWGKKIDPDPMQHLPGYTKEYFRRWNILNTKGLTDDIPNPINYYGRTKLEAENILRGSRKSYLIIRTNVLYL